MFRITIIAVFLTFAYCWPIDEEMEGTTRPPIQPVSCEGHDPDKMFRDPLNPHIFHQCSRGKWIAGFWCPGNLVFDEKEQTCDRDPDVPVVKCPKPDGLFEMPGNPHKFIDCQGGIGYVITCPEDLVFSELNQTCVYNDHGLTWPTDPTIAPTKPTASPTASPTSGPTSGPTASPTAASTAGSTARPTAASTAGSTARPTAASTAGSTARPTAASTAGSTARPTAASTAGSTARPTAASTAGSTARPTAASTAGSTARPTVRPTTGPTVAPSVAPTSHPSPSPQPSTPE